MADDTSAHPIERLEREVLNLRRTARVQSRGWHPRSA